MFRTFIFVFLFCFPSAFWADEAKPDTDYQPARLPHALETVLPPELRFLHIESPRIVFRVIVDPSGNASDYLAVEATHFGLLEKGEKKLSDADFEPAMKDGKAVAGKIRSELPDHQFDEFENPVGYEDRNRPPRAGCLIKPRVSSGQGPVPPMVAWAGPGRALKA